jgi:transcriptional regulator with XRE-family HTH domain
MSNELDEKSELFGQYVCAELKGAIVTRGFSQAEVAKAIGKQKANLSRWLNAKPVIPIDVAQAVCEFIGASLKEIVDRATKRVDKEFASQQDNNDLRERAQHITALGLAAKAGDIDGEQEAYEEMP